MWFSEFGIFRKLLYTVWASIIVRFYGFEAAFWAHTRFWLIDIARLSLTSQGGLEKVIRYPRFLFFLVIEALHVSLLAAKDSGIYRGLILPKFYLIFSSRMDDAVFIGEPWRSNILRLKIVRFSLINMLRCQYI